MRLARNLATAAAIVVLAIGSAPAVSAEETARSTEDAVAHLAELINSERANQGLRLLEIDGAVNREAQQHSVRMAEAGEIFHNDDLFTPEAKDRLGAKMLGENVASNGSLDDAHRRLMASDGHRANILRPSFDRLGIGVETLDGTWYITEVFVESRGEPAPGASAGPTRASAQMDAPAPVPAGVPPVDGTSAGGSAVPHTTVPREDHSRTVRHSGGGTVATLEVVAVEEPPELIVSRVSANKPAPTEHSPGRGAPTAAMFVAAALLILTIRDLLRQLFPSVDAVPTELV